MPWYETQKMSQLYAALTGVPLTLTFDLEFSRSSCISGMGGPIAIMVMERKERKSIGWPIVRLSWNAILLGTRGLKMSAFPSTRLVDIYFHHNILVWFISSFTCPIVFTFTYGHYTSFTINVIPTIYIHQGHDDYHQNILSFITITVTQIKHKCTGIHDAVITTTSGYWRCSLLSIMYVRSCETWDQNQRKGHNHSPLSVIYIQTNKRWLCYSVAQVSVRHSHSSFQRRYDGTGWGKINSISRS